MEETSTSEHLMTADKVNEQHVEIVTALPVEVDRALPLAKALAQNTRLSAFGIWLILNNLLYGYEIVFLGGIAGLPAFQVVFGSPTPDTTTAYAIPTAWLSLWSISGPIGNMIGAIIAGWLQDVIGRRLVLAIAAALQAGTVTICYLADQAGSDNGDRGLYFAGKLAQGIAIGAILCSTQTYASEILPARLRGPILALPPIFTILGEIIGATIIRSRVNTLNPSSYRVPIAVQWAFSAIPLLLALLLPESPAWLLRKNKVDAAREACFRLEGSKAAEAPGNLMDRLRETLAFEAVEYDAHRELSYRDCFRRQHGNLRRTLIVMFVTCIPQLFGLAFLGHATYVLEVHGMSADDANSWFIGGTVLALVASLFSFWLITKFRRRTLLLSTLMIIIVMWLMAGIAGSIKTTANIWVLATSTTLVNGVACLGAWPIAYVVAAEASTLSLRAKVQGISVMVQGLSTAIFAFFLPYLYNYDAADLGAQMGFIFVGFALIALVISWLCVPDMKDRTPVEIDKMFEMGLSTRKFEHFSGDAATGKSEGLH